ncbi:MAG: hypothetical protein Wins2KO_20280 [Winogradskyella sp.]
MKNSKSKLAKVIASVAVVCALMFTADIFAQGPPNGATDTVDVPIDGGLVALLVGAAAFGVKKLRDNLK